MLNFMDDLTKYTQELCTRSYLIWEEIQLENAPTEKLIKAKEMIENELVKRSIKEQTNERNRKVV